MQHPYHVDAGSMRLGEHKIVVESLYRDAAKAFQPGDSCIVNDSAVRMLTSLRQVASTAAM
jgi:hypothetical protein